MKNSLRSPGVLLVLWYLLKIQNCRGQALIGSSQPIISRVGDDVTLPCFFQTPRDAAALTFEWTRPDLQPRFVYVWRSFEELRDLKNPQFDDRTFLYQDELKKGNISLKLTNVKAKDSGVYRCFFPALRKETSIRLIVASSSPVVVSVASVDVWGSGVVLQCASGGWFPEPELWWLDSEGALLSVEHSVSVSDGLYEVSSRMSVEQSGTFSCTVNQSSTNLSEKNSVQVEDYFNGVKIFPVFIVLTVGLVVFAGAAIILLLFLLRATKQKTQTDEPKLEEPTCNDMDEETPSKEELNTYITSAEEENKILKTKLEELNTRITSAEEENKTLKTKLVKEIKLQQEIQSTRTLSPVIIDSFHQYGTYVRLKTQECVNLRKWSLHIEVDNDKALIYTFEHSLTLRNSGDTVTIYAQGHCPSDPSFRFEKEWENQTRWNTGKIAFVSLYDDTNTLKDRICERMFPTPH
ncbi:butyrophilin subfamily 3 member A2-like [Boleophthalmus pectinirostris]|uniref:butyrophilin subfamily 3 member A2-like n=1 Tax=Boleophthalmus pectinirostris TaxID=150288 RepID=UPI00242B6FC2|nr:butyrophilin subfamily 3 member A2-like [Boleophthalmus pectinirostris]